MRDVEYLVAFEEVPVGVKKGRSKQVTDRSVRR